MEDLKIVYKGKEYLLEDLQRESNDLQKELILPKEFQVSDLITEFGLINDKGYAIAGEKFRDLYSVIASARFALIKAHTKIHQNEVSWGSGYIGQLWLRSQYLQNSIIWYNSCEDYTLQIIWFAFEFFTNLEKYKEEMEKCRYGTICMQLKGYKDQSEAINLFQYLKSYHDNKDIFYIRSLANSLKHKQYLKFKGLNHNRSMGFNSNNFSSEMIEPKQVDIDETIECLRLVHKQTVEFASYLFSYIDFNEMFVRNEAGDMTNKIKPKMEYKKIIINANINN